MSKIVNCYYSTVTSLSHICNKLRDLGLLVIRLWLFKVFFNSAMTKFYNFESTVFLFKHEFKVPLLTPEWAAYIGTGAEFILAIMVLVGLAGRIAPLAFLLFNAVMVYSYPFLWTPEGAAAMNQHIFWAFIMGVLVMYGHGKVSLDYLIHKQRHDYHF